MGNSLSRRIQWIDCARMAAMIAVVIDHCYAILYTNRDIFWMSVFSVSLFVLLSGISAWDSSSVKKHMSSVEILWNQLLKLRGLLGQYALATFLLQIYYYRFFDLKTYLSLLVNFSIQDPYYFLLFFFQLRIISPFLISWCGFCNKRKRPIAWHLATVVALFWFCAASVNYTFILPVHGGGKYLLGGTYLFVYYLGILLANLGCFCCSVKIRVVILFCSGNLWIFWWRMLCAGRLTLDQLIAKYWGAGGNPPSIQWISFGVITLFLVYAFVTLAEELNFKWTNRIVSTTAYFGKYTLYTFMYHLMVKDIMINTFPVIQTNIWILRICVFSPMLTFPALMVCGIQRLRLYVRAKYSASIDVMESC